MLSQHGVGVVLAARSLASGAFSIADYLPAAAVAVVLLSLSVALVVVSAHRKDDA